MNSYNSFSELQTQSTSFNATNVFSESFSRDNIGRITQKTEVINNVTTVYNYSYDLSGRLTQVRRDNVLINNYTYDQNSNRIAKNSITATYDVQDRIITSGNNVYAFNDHGDVATKTNGPQITSYQFDVFGQLKIVNLPNGSVVSYKTDGENKRFARLINGVVQTMYSYNSKGQLVSEHNADGTLRSRYIYGTQAHSPDYMIKNNIRYSLIKDHLGSIRLVMNTTTGAVAQQLNYDEFGIVSLDSNPGFQTFGYAGGLYDSSTGLVRFGAREYDAESGRWLQKDPIRFQGGDTNLYGYVGQDPINYVDPSGLWAIVIGGGFTGIFGGGAEGSAGFVIGTNEAGQIEAGAFFSGGGGFGVNVGVDIFAGYYPGNISSVGGQSLNYSAGAGPVTGSFFTDPATGRPIGGTIGIGFSFPIVGASISTANTNLLTGRAPICQ